MSELGRFLRSVRHTRPRQLVARVAKIAKRAVHDSFGARWAEGELERSIPPLASAPPLPVFAPRRERIVDAREPSIRVLATTHSLSDRIDWRPRGWNELQLVNLHYMEFLEGLDDAQFSVVVRDWMARNSVGERGSWRIAWNSYALSLRVVVWMQQLALRRERLSHEITDAVHASLTEQLRFLERHLELDVVGNHLIKNVKALIWAGHYFEGDEARRWRELGRELLARELVEQVLADGMHFERSPAYHCQVFADLLECAALVEDARLGDALDAMAQVAVDLTHPDGLPSQFNDGGLHMAYSPSECLAAYSKLTGKTVRVRGVFALRSAGYFGARDDDSFVLADCGAIAPDYLPAHGHGDLLAFEWSLAGQRVIVDAGVFEYERGAWRDRARATSSHNTLTLDDADQCEFWAAFRVGRRARARLHRFDAREHGFVLEGSHDGYAHLRGSPRHVRKLTATRGALEVEDRVVGGAGQSVRARLLLHPDARVERVEDSLRIRVGAVAISLACEHPCEVVDAWWCPDFGVRVPTKQIVIAYPPAPCRGSFCLQRTSVSRNSAEPRSLVDSSNRERSVSS